MAEDDVRDCKEIPMENKEWLDILENAPHFPATHAAAFSELFSVAVHRDYFGQRDTIQIYGTIIIYDEDQNSIPYDLYTRDFDDAETLTPQHNLLSLDMPVECLVSTTWLHMYFNLKDKADGALILENDFYFDKLTDINQYNKVQQVTLNSVVVTYAAFSAAVVAVLDITLIKPKDTAPVPLNLHGKITARCGNTYGHKYPGIVLLTTPSYQPIQANVPILLSRDVVVVPAYSFLRIDVHLSQPHHQDITCQADFLARHLYTNDCDIVANDDFVVRFNVQWCHPLQLELQTKQPIECPKISTDVRVHDVGRRPRSLLEVYTVMVHHDTNRELKIYGKMSVRDNWTGFSLFNRKVLNPFILSGNVETIPIYVKRRCLNLSEYLAMDLKLKDVEGQVLIEGQIYWDDCYAQEPISWYDTPMCSVIPGVHGYAAVFYSIFSKARQTEVRISFEWDGYPDVRYSLDGSVVARHSKGIYLTVHDKAYYQSVLFRGNSSDLQSGCTVPLSKSVVAVPIDAFLTVAIDLDASPLSCELPEEHLTWDVTFNMVPDVKQIKGKGKCIIKVSVEWSDFRKIFSEEKDSDSE